MLNWSTSIHIQVHPMYHVLYVDDEPDLLEITKLYLEASCEFAVDTAMSAQEMLNNRDLSVYDAIISDYQMPEMDGITFLKEVRARFGTLPFILFTGRGREEVVIQAINNGADFYIQKGGDPRSQFAELSHKIRSAAFRRRAEDALRKSEEKYRHLIKHSNEAIVVGQDGMLQLVNQRTVEFTGFSEPELLSRPFSAFVHPDDRAMVMERYLKRIVGEDVPSRYSFRLSQKDGGTRWIEMSGVATDWDGRPATLNFLTDITEHKLGEKALMDHEEQSRNLLSLLPEMVMVHRDGIIVYANQMAADKTGFSREELIGSQIFDYMVLADREIIARNIVRRAAGERVGDYEVEMVHKSGALHHVIARTSPIVFNQVPSVVVILVDITERKLAEVAVKESENLYRTIFETTGAASIIIENDTTITRANLGFATLSGFSREELEGKKSWTDFVVPEDLEQMKQYHRDRRDDPLRETRIYEFRFINRSGEIRHCINNVRVIPGTARSVASVVDITYRKQAETELETKHDELMTSYEELTATEEELRASLDALTQQEMALRESETQLRATLESTADGVLAVDNKGKILQASRRFAEIWRIPPSLVERGNDRALLDFVLSQLTDPDAFLKKVQSLYGSDAVDMDTLIFKDSRVIERYSFPMIMDGVCIGRVWSFRDVTDQKRAEEALQESKRQLDAMATNIPGVVYQFYVNPDGTTGFDYISERSRQILGLENDPVTIFEQIAGGIVSEDRERFLSTVQHAISTKTLWEFESQYVKPSGKKIWISAVSSPIIKNDRLTFDGVVFDNTERKRAEEALRHVNRKLNLLSGITRHDINNQLTILQAYLTILENKQPDPLITEYCRKATTAAERISAMIQFTKEYEQIGVNVPAWQNCRTLVDTAAKQASLGEVIVKNDLPVGMEVFADPLIFRVCYNLMDNAVRYGGEITTIRFSIQESGDDVLILCEDDGDGVLAEEKERIFDRGFGKNTGLGLALSREILDITGITIRETGEPGKGGRFEMTMPKGMWRIARKIT